MVSLVDRRYSKKEEFRAGKQASKKFLNTAAVYDDDDDNDDDNDDNVVASLANLTSANLPQSRF